MNWFNASVALVMVWWTVLFAVLPFGTRPEPDADPVTGWRGAPAKPLIGRKLAVTTVIALIVWGAILLVARSEWVSFRPR